MSFSGIYDHAVVIFAMSKIMEFTKEEQNRIALYLVNCKLHLTKTNKSSILVLN